ncbi:MAG: nucleotidyltransferase family protein [Rikenellaceae bacterium]|nr:nucleotidyltransferase family protein [Rikenellaceae bacterium]
MECIVLAGGLGTRLRAQVGNLPKAMAPVAGKPFLYHLFKYLEKNSVQHVILSLGYRHELIEEWVSNNNWNFDISFSIEDTPLGTGGAIKKSMEESRYDNVIVINGDTFFDIPLDDFHRKHCEKTSPISLALKPMEKFSRYGNVLIDDSGLVTGFMEKKHCDKKIINGGTYCLNKSADIFGAMNGKFSFETDVLEKNICDINGIVYDKYFIDIGIPEDFNKANTDFRINV